MKYPANSLAVKLFLANAILIVTALLVSSLNGYWQSRQAIDSVVYNHVYGIMQERAARLRMWHQETVTKANSLVNTVASNTDVTESLIDQMKSKNNSFSYVAAFNKRSDEFQMLYDSGTYTDRIEPGITITDHNHDMHDVRFGKIHLDKHGNSILNVIATNVGDDSSSYLVLLQIDIAKCIQPILSDTTGLGMQGECFLIGVDSLMLTPSRFYNHPDPLTHKMPIPAVVAALMGETGVNVYQNYLGQQVVGAYDLLTDMGWVIIVEMVTEQAFAPLDSFTMNTLIVGGTALLLLLVLSMLISRTWTRPLTQLAAASESVAGGDYEVGVSEGKRLDEIGTLSRQFNRMVASIRDSRKKLQDSHQKLVQSEKLAVIGELASSIVHEMRNPLSVIKMNLNLLQRKPNHSLESDPVAAEQLKLATDEAIKLENMLSELLDFSKPIQLKISEVKIADLLNLTKSSVDGFTFESDILVNFVNQCEADTAIFIDQDLISRALINLIANSVQASNRGTEVELGVSAIENYIKFKVTDYGKGMNESTQDRLFDPFFTTREDGVGLGMSNVKKIVELHQGRINVHSKVGEGTKIEILIP